MTFVLNIPLWRCWRLAATSLVLLTVFVTAFVTGVGPQKVVPLITKAGFDPIWFSILFLVVIQTSYLTPPMAPAIFYLKGIVPPEIKVKDMFLGVLPYIVLQLIGIAIIILFPQIALWLPKVMIGFH